MSKRQLFLLTLLAVAQVVHADPVHLRTNSLDSPLGIDTLRPTFSWQSNATTSNWMQSSYEILVATDAKNLLPHKLDAWDSGRMKSSESVNITYGGAAIKSQQRYFWKVITWDDKGALDNFRACMVETGLQAPPGESAMDCAQRSCSRTGNECDSLDMAAEFGCDARAPNGHASIFSISLASQ